MKKLTLCGSGPFRPKADEYKCIDCGAEITGFKNYSARQMAEQAKSKFGRYLCIDCAKKAGELQKAEEQEGDVLSENNED